MRIALLTVAVFLVAASCGGSARSDGTSTSQIAAGDGLTCVIVDDGGVACWGNRAYMGAGFTPGDAALGVAPPVAVALPDGMRFTQVTSTRTPYGYQHACALASDGTVWCWGDNQVSQLGNGSDCCGETPVAVTMPPETVFTQISAGAEHTCALAGDGTVWCWGNGDHGQLGDGSPTASEWESGTSWHTANTPTRVLLPDLVVAKVASGHYYTCVLAVGGEVWCWGDDSTGHPAALPVALVMPPDVSFTDLASDEGEMCGLTIQGAVWCWPIGWGGSDSRGFKTAEPVIAPMPDGVPMLRLAAGRAHMCGLSSDGVVWCWGPLGGYGTSGSYYGDVKFPEEEASTPVDLSSASGQRFVDLAAGTGHTCAIATDSTVWCWGYNDFGQLGDGSTRSSLTPVKVSIDLRAPAPAASPAAPLTLEPVVLEPYSGDAFLSPPPVWSLGTEQSRRIYGVFVGGDWQVPEYWGISGKCTGDGGGSGEECLYAYLAKLGVSLEALSLFRDYGISVSRVAGSGPVWVAESYDWSTFETNYDDATPNLIFTPNGIFNVSGSGVGSDVDARDAFEAAFASDLDERILAAEYAAWGAGNEEIYLGPYSENFIVPLVAPERISGGWSIQYQVQVGSGFHCCSYPFYARFALDLDDAGSPSGVRFLDWCYVDRVPFYSDGEPLPEMRAIEEIGASLPLCSTG